MIAAFGERRLPDRRAPRALGAILMPLGPFSGCVLNNEGDPSHGILLVPVGGLVLLYALVESASATRPRDSR